MTNLYSRRACYTDDHEAFRDSVRGFLSRYVTDHVEEWEACEHVPRAVWQEAGSAGLLGLMASESLGGGGSQDYFYRSVFIEEAAKVGASSVAAGFAVHTDIVMPYLMDLATTEQSERWLPGMIRGELIGAIAMTEPGAGSDLRGIRTTAQRVGDGWVLNGSKTFISNGINSDVVIVVARTDGNPDAGSRAFSLFVVEADTPGFTRGRRLKKIGLHAQDTAELHFADVRLSRANLLGEEGRGLHALMAHLPLERLSIAVTACAGARAALSWTIDYVTQREAFGRPLADLQNTQFALAEMATELDIAQAYVDQSIHRLNDDDLTAVDASKAKWWTSEMHQRTVGRCLQLFGGYGYMLEYPIARAYLDTRVTTIYGGTTEIMKTIIARDLLSFD